MIINLLIFLSVFFFQVLCACESPQSKLICISDDSMVRYGENVPIVFPEYGKFYNNHDGTVQEFFNVCSSDPLTGERFIDSIEHCFQQKIPFILAKVTSSMQITSSKGVALSKEQKQKYRSYYNAGVLHKELFTDGKKVQPLDQLRDPVWQHVIEDIGYWIIDKKLGKNDRGSLLSYYLNTYKNLISHVQQNPIYGSSFIFSNGDTKHDVSYSKKIYNVLANDAMMQGKYEEAKQFYKRLLHVCQDPLQEQEVYFCLINIAKKQNKLENISGYREQIIAIDAPSAIKQVCLYEKAQLLLENKDFDQALQFFKQAVYSGLNEDINQNCYEKIVSIYQQQHKDSESLPWLDLIVDMSCTKDNKTQQKILLKRGMTLQSLKCYSQALQDYTQAIELKADKKITAEVAHYKKEVKQKLRRMSRSGSISWK